MPLNEKGAEIMANMQEQYGKVRGERIFYASENAGTIEGVHDQGMEESMSPAGSGFDNDVDERTCDESAFPVPDQAYPSMTTSAPMTSTPTIPSMDKAEEDCATDAVGAESYSPRGTTGYSINTEDQPIVMPPVPSTMFEHPQLHPDASTPPEMAVGDNVGVYGGIAGGLTDWSKDCFSKSSADNWPAYPSSASGPPFPNPAESPGCPEITPDELVEQSRRYWGQME
jgi:hypothetical protein